MKLNFIQDYATSTLYYESGNEHDVDDDTAHRLIATGIAVEVHAKKPVKVTAEKPEAPVKADAVTSVITADKKVSLKLDK